MGDYLSLFPLNSNFLQTSFAKIKTNRNYFSSTDLSQRNKKDRYTGEPITSAPLIADPSSIWLGDRANERRDSRANLNEKIKTKFKERPRTPSLQIQSKFKHRKRQATIEEEATIRNSESKIDCDYQVLQCVLFDSKGYVIYSAVGSFFIPMFIMIFFYWRIYLVAMYTTKALNRGYISKKSIRTNPLAILTGYKSGQADGLGAVKYGSTNAGGPFGDAGADTSSNLTLRVHRGYFKDQQLSTNMANDLSRKSASRTSYDSTGRHSSTSTTVTVRANSTIDTTTAAALCRRLLPTRLSNRLLSNSDAKQLRKIQHRSVRCLDRTQNIISLAADSSSPRPRSMPLKRTQSEQYIELSTNKSDDEQRKKPDELDNKVDNKLDDKLDKDNEANNDNKSLDKPLDKNENLDKTEPNDDKKESLLKSTENSMRTSNSEKNIAKSDRTVIRTYSQSSGNLSAQQNCPIQLNIVPPQEDKPNQQNADSQADQRASTKTDDQASRANGYRNSEINNNYQKENSQTDLIETLDTNCNNNLTQPLTAQVATSGSGSSKYTSYWSRFSKKRTNLNKTANQNTNSSEKRRFIAETKAAKTVGIIVGCFWCCWFPFFTVYLTRGLCEDKNCIPDIILTLFTWLGYINSALVGICYSKLYYNVGSTL